MIIDEPPRRIGSIARDLVDLETDHDALREMAQRVAVAWATYASATTPYTQAVALARLSDAIAEMRAWLR